MTQNPPEPTPLGPGTLGRQLLIRIVLLIAVIAIGVSAVTALATRESLMRSVDRQLDAAFSRQDRRGFGGGDGINLPPGQAAGTIVVDTSSGTVRGGVLSDTGRGVESLRVEAAMALLALPTDGQARSIHLEDYGNYRAKVMTNGSTTRAVAIPLTEVDRALRDVLGFALVLTLIALVGAVLVVRALVIRTLEPLHRLAGTARQVSQLELARGEVALPVRVDEADADPRTEVGRVGQAFNHMLGNVEQALSARQSSEMKVRRFVADASHELRNPLAAIRGYAELTRLQGADAAADNAHAMARVEAEAERMSKLVEDMLLLARLDSRPDLHPEQVEVTEIVLNATSDAQAADPAYDWGVDVPDQPVFARADRHQLHQVVANLLSNAARHTPAGTSVTTSVGIEGTDVVVAVTDNGPGIPAEIQDTVFERFTRADTARSRSGKSKGSTGLGLAIVAAVMAAHGGSATVSSEPGRTVFTLRFPQG